MRKKLPVLLSIPHGGTKKPPELDGHLCITPHDQFEDSDPFVTELYDLRDRVQRVIKTDIARAFVDLNRPLQDSENPDGLIKSSTCYEKAIYFEKREPDDALRNLLIEMYYKPYHNQIQKSMHELDLKLCLDCHSMAEYAPPISPDKDNSPRPAFCLSNQNGDTSSQKIIETLAECICESFSLENKDVKLNEPFKGGYITKEYGNKPVPWIQIEMNRNQYLVEPWFEHKSLVIDHTKLQELNKKFENTLDLFFEGTE